MILLSGKSSYAHPGMFSFSNLRVKYFFDHECPRGKPISPNILINYTKDEMIFLFKVSGEKLEKCIASQSQPECFEGDYFIWRDITQINILAEMFDEPYLL